MASQLELGRPHRDIARRFRYTAERTIELSGCSFSLASEDISFPTYWQISHDFHTLIVHLHGRMQRLETRIDGCKPCGERATNGDMWLIPAGSPYMGVALGNQISYAEFNFERGWLAELAGSMGATTSLQPTLRFRDPLLYGLTGKLADLIDQEDDIAQMMRDNIAQTIGLHLLRDYTTDQKRVSHGTPHILAAPIKLRIEDYINTNLEKHLTSEEIAGVAGIPSHQLATAFRASFGQTPLQYIIFKRLQLACNLLESTRQDISTIAMASGFSSHSHLSHAFKQHYGLTPQQFRRTAKERSSDG